MHASASACSACYGKSDDAMAQGMNAGIFSLLAVVVPVLGGIGGFFVYLVKRSAAASAAAIASSASQTAGPADAEITVGHEHAAARA